MDRCSQKMCSARAALWRKSKETSTSWKPSRSTRPQCISLFYLHEFKYQNQQNNNQQQQNVTLPPNNLTPHLIPNQNNTQGTNNIEYEWELTCIIKYTCHKFSIVYLARNINNFNSKIMNPSYDNGKGELIRKIFLNSREMKD